jgi:meso-butanediol dehydrogenase / (S,S)-butanediol dehydrogenase / diacetyl reductase
MTQLVGKVALVTGASAGLGAVTAQLFAERGATVFGIARDADRMATVFEQVPGGKYASVDIADPAACRQAVTDCVAEFGRLDILANIAGFHQMRHTPTMTDEEWNRDLAVNLNGPFYLCRAALPHLLETGGNIVNVSSIAGVEGEVYSAGYCSAKHGLIGLTRVAALETATDGITVNAICPGLVDTPLVQNQLADLAALQGLATEDVIERFFLPLVPQRRLLDPREIATMVRYLVSDEGRGITGQAINVSAGWIMH